MSSDQLHSVSIDQLVIRVSVSVDLMSTQDTGPCVCCLPQAKIQHRVTHHETLRGDKGLLMSPAVSQLKDLQTQNSSCLWLKSIRCLCLQHANTADALNEPRMQHRSSKAVDVAALIHDPKEPHLHMPLR